MLTQLLILLRAQARALSPRMWLIGAAALLVFAGLCGLYLKGRHDAAAHARAKTQTAVAQATIAALDVRGARETTQRLQIAIDRRQAANAATTQLASETLQTEDVHEPLAPDVAARLRADDHELCLTAPELAGCAADSDAR